MADGQQPLTPVIAPHLHASFFQLVSAGSEIILLLGQGAVQFSPEGISDQVASMPVAMVHMSPVALKELGLVIGQFLKEYEANISYEITSPFIEQVKGDRKS